ncbi:MAG: glycine oxidase ThiO [Gemmatimonadales bacterium]
MPPTYDVIVIGGGAIGAACARELALGGRSVLIIEPGGASGQAWQAAAGMLAPQIEANGADPLLELGLAARDHYRDLGANLREATGLDIGLWQDGIARVAGDDVEADELRSKVESQQQRGHACDWLEAGEVHRRWPWLGPTAGALWAPRDGALDPEQLVRALLADAARYKATLVKDRAIGIDEREGRVAGVSTESARYSAPAVILAAGAWSGQLNGVPRSIPVQPVRGQMAALPWPAGVGRAIVYHKDCYLLARGNEAILGSTMEYVGFRPEVTPDGIARIFAATMALCPGLIRGKPRRTWAGLRPVTPDGLPIIGEEPQLSGLWYATGHGRNGILLAGITGVLIHQLLDREGPVADVRAFSASRFE